MWEKPTMLLRCRDTWKGRELGCAISPPTILKLLASYFGISLFNKTLRGNLGQTDEWRLFGNTKLAPKYQITIK